MTIVGIILSALFISSHIEQALSWKKRSLLSSLQLHFKSEHVYTINKSIQDIRLSKNNITRNLMLHIDKSNDIIFYRYKYSVITILSGFVGGFGYIKLLEHGDKTEVKNISTITVSFLMFAIGLVLVLIQAVIKGGNKTIIVVIILVIIGIVYDIIENKVIGKQAYEKDMIKEVFTYLLK